MTILEKLDILIERRRLNAHTFALESNIPYTTIKAFYAKGTKNMKLSTVIKICKFFEISYDEFIDEDIDISFPEEYLNGVNIAPKNLDINLPQEYIQL